MPPLRVSIQSVVAIAAISLAIGCHHAEPVPTGDIAATLVAPTLGDAVFDPNTLRGKPAIIMFVSPTCSHCIAEIPRAQEVAAEKGATAIAVFVAGNADAAVAVVAKTGFKGTVLVDEGGALRAKYNVQAVPYTLILNADGTARAAFRGEQDAATIRKAIADAS